MYQGLKEIQQADINRGVTWSWEFAEAVKLYVPLRRLT